MSAQSSGAAALARGVGRLLHDMGYASLTEFRLSSGRRADVAGLDRKGVIIIVENRASPTFRPTTSGRVI